MNHKPYRGRTITAALVSSLALGAGVSAFGQNAPVLSAQLERHVAPPQLPITEDASNKIVKAI